jgi:hypothetical protein
LYTIGGLFIGVMSPPLLRLAVRRGVDAGILLTVWAVVVSLAVIAIAMPAVAILIHGCWLSPDTGLPRWVDSLTGLLSGATVVIAVARGARQLANTRRRRRNVHARHIELSWLLTGRAPRADSVLWLPTAEPHAYSLAGSPPLVVMSVGLRECLGHAAVSAVRSHEKAHIHRRHHVFVAVAQALSAGLGWLPLIRQSPGLVRTLIELDADANAARVHGSWPIRQAIHTLQHAAAPAAALGIATECAQLRLERLTTHCPDDAVRRPRSAATGSAMIITSVLTFTALLLASGVISCGP